MNKQAGGRMVSLPEFDLPKFSIDLHKLSSNSGGTGIAPSVLQKLKKDKMMTNISKFDKLQAKNVEYLSNNSIPGSAEDFDSFLLTAQNDENVLKQQSTHGNKTDNKVPHQVNSNASFRGNGIPGSKVILQSKFHSFTDPNTRALKPEISGVKQSSSIRRYDAFANNGSKYSKPNDLEIDTSYDESLISIAQGPPTVPRHFQQKRIQRPIPQKHQKLERIYEVSDDGYTDDDYSYSDYKQTRDDKRYSKPVPYRNITRQQRPSSRYYRRNRRQRHSSNQQYRRFRDRYESLSNHYPCTSNNTNTNNRGYPIMPINMNRIQYGMVPSPIPVPSMMPVVVNQTATSALTAIASRSLLTCSKDFQSQFPNVYLGLCKGLIDVNRLIANEVVIPIKEEISLHKNSIRSRRAVTAALSEQLWKPLHGKFPDPAMAPKLVHKIAEYFYDKIEAGIVQAEDERSILQWMFRFDVENAIEIRVTTSLGVGFNSAIANIEGSAQIKRKKGDFLSLLNPDTITFDMDIVIKALFLNGGQLSEINNDPIFVDHIQAGENKFAASFINYY